MRRGGIPKHRNTGPYGIGAVESGYADLPILECGDMALWRAVIAMAILDLTGRARSRNTVAAYDWAASCSSDFRFVCDMADLDAYGVHRRVMKIIDARLKADPYTYTHIPSIRTNTAMALEARRLMDAKKRARKKLRKQGVV